MKRFFLFLLLLWPCFELLGTPQKPSGQSPVNEATKSKKAPPGVSLDLLAARVIRHWVLLARGNRIQAASFIYPSDRKTFESSQAQQFRDPRLKSLELSNDPSDVIVTVVVKRTVPPLPVEMDWPVAEHWKFENGSWYRRFDAARLPMTGKTEPSNPIEMELLRQMVRAKLHFEKTELDIGTVNQGTNVVVSLKYSLKDSDSIPVVLKSAPSGSDCAECSRERAIGFVGAKEQQISPGEGQELSIEIPTWNYDGAVKDKFTLIAKTKEVDVPFEFSVRGNVYTPISVIPRTMQFKKGEREKELLIRNNSKKELRVGQYISETRAITLDPFPLVIPPGQEVKVKVKAQQALDDALPGTVDRMAITYTPVDGFAGLSYKIYLNAPEEKPATPSR